MTGASWVAGSIRARALVRRRLGRDAARALAGTGSLEQALGRVRASAYAERLGSPGTVGEARRALADTTLWNLRVMAGWLPAAGVEVVRMAAGPFEIANIMGRLGALGGGAPDRPFDLGRLARSWSRLAHAGSVAVARADLASSAWRVPATEAPERVEAVMWLTWARRVARLGGPSAGWAAAGAAVVVAREWFAFDRPPGDHAARQAGALLGPRWADATDVADLRGRLRAPAGAALEGITAPEDLWLAELAVRHRIEREANAVLVGARWGPQVIAAAAALLLLDLLAAGAALECAARGGRAPEVFDALT